MIKKMQPYVLAFSNNPTEIDQTYVLSNPQLLNSYSYSLNNPINYSDPSGKCPFCVIGLVVVAGATQTSLAFKKSLQSALEKARL
jgi:hypothetical protein